MIENFFYVILALMGLGLLVFIHELGHYLIARRVGMTVETFSIGFGKPIHSWKHDGVLWQIGVLPFGGYVKIAGMEKTGALEPYQIADGFYGKKPVDRIKVALAGPIVNITFAFILFCVIWLGGGRNKPFSEYTRLIGWVNPVSSLYNQGVRSGDEILSINGRAYNGFQDFLYAAILDKKAAIEGEKIDYETNEKSPFSATLFQNADDDEARLRSLDVLSPASFLIYKEMKDSSIDSLLNFSPMKDSGIEDGDRILWVDGELIFSKRDLSSILNDAKTLLTVKRDNKVFLTRVPRLKVSDIRFSPQEKAEVDDWNASHTSMHKVEDLYFIPFNITTGCEVESVLTYIGEDSQEHTFKAPFRSRSETQLKEGDKIIAVDGQPISSGVELLKALQTRKLQIIVQKDKAEEVEWKDADRYFNSLMQPKDLQAIASTIGTQNIVKSAGDLRLLNPVTPITYEQFELAQSVSSDTTNRLEQIKKDIEATKDPKERALKLENFEHQKSKMVLGIVLYDQMVRYNPGPFKLFSNVMGETFRTLTGLFSGSLSPKYMMGPVGIVQVMHQGWSLGIQEALYWLALISLNLGIFNLLPIPVLDGGHICFSLYEMFTKKPLKAKTMERLIQPFIIALILLFIFLTYQDILRMISRIFQ